MTGLVVPNVSWMPAVYYALAVVSAVVPWANAEVLMLSAVPLTGSPMHLGVLVVAVTLGQMTGKSVMYWASRHAAYPRGRRLQSVIDRGREHFHRHPRGALGVMLVSALMGLPPFYLVVLAAGALNIAFIRFFVVGFAGRLAHFALVAFVPHLIGRMS
jgi:membrane protein YqaA with SNARE-associated domain